jgi:hypothetical protein
MTGILISIVGLGFGVFSLFMTNPMQSTISAMGGVILCAIGIATTNIIKYIKQGQK